MAPSNVGTRVRRSVWTFDVPDQSEFSEPAEGRGGWTIGTVFRPEDSRPGQTGVWSGFALMTAFGRASSAAHALTCATCGTAPDRATRLA